MSAIQLNPANVPATFRAESSRVYAQLREQHLALWGKLAWRRLFLPDSVVSSIETALNQALKTFAKLSPNGTLTMAVLSGAQAPSTWQNVADDTADLLTSAGQYMGEAMPSIDRITSEILRPTAEQVAAEVEGGATVVAELLPWAVVGLVALVVGYVVLTFRR